MGSPRPPVLVLVTGPPGTGKSTVAAAVARRLGAAVLGHDWVMSGLRPFSEVEAALDAMEPDGHRPVGWSILVALARSELRAGRPVVLDGVARVPEAAQCATLARDEGAGWLVVATACSDRDVHRRRVEGRDRAIPGWYELEWGRVEGSLRSWDPPAHDLALDAVEPWPANELRLAAFFEARGW